MAIALINRGRHFSGAAITAALLAACTTAPVSVTPEAFYPPGPQLKYNGTALLMEDYAMIPLSGRRNDGPYPGKIDMTEQLGRANALRSEPAGAPQSDKRFFVPGQNGMLYILDKTTRQFTPYLDIGKIFPKFSTEPVYGMGLISIAFDPGYAKNGRFYTVHSERPNMPGAPNGKSDAIPNLKIIGDVTPAIVRRPASEVEHVTDGAHRGHRRIENPAWVGVNFQKAAS